jgi:WD40 repeat protein
MKGVERRVQLRDLSELRLEGGVPVGPKVSGSWAVPEGQFVSASLSGGVVRLLLQTEDGRLKAWRSSDGALRLLDGSEGEFDPAAWSSNGARVAAVSKDNKVVSVWNADDGRRLISIPCADINPTMIGLSDDGSLVITANADGAARIFPATVRGFFDVANRILGRSKLADAPRVRRTTRTRWFANP